MWFLRIGLADLLARIRHLDSLKAAILILPTLLFLAIFFAFPFFITGRYSIGAVDQYNRLIQSAFTIGNYVTSFEGMYLVIQLRSLLIALGTTVLCIALGYPVAYWIGVKAGKMKNLAMLLVIIPFWSSFLIRTYAMMSLLY